MESPVGGGGPLPRRKGALPRLNWNKRADAESEVLLETKVFL
jgi:hypothetical protein